MSAQPVILERHVDEAAMQQLVSEGLAPAMARILAARGITTSRQLEISLAGLIPPERLTNNQRMACIMADAIAGKKRFLVVGDYDADGATATVVAVRGLRSMGAAVDFLVPNRFEYGYGLTPEIVALAAQQTPDIILTVDNGIASVDGVNAANALGIEVLITDHHLPGEVTPDASCILNPNQHGCDFPSKHLAGVGVMFYALLALRAELRQRGAFQTQEAPNLTELLDIVALGTVADLVRLDDNNRILVEQGLRRIRAGRACPGINALLQIAGKSCHNVSAKDLGFSLGPRLNAAGRLDDMSLGISCLLADNAADALRMAQTLHELNLTRRTIETDMQEIANEALSVDVLDHCYTVSLYHPDWHQGVIGILASRIKERHHRPVIAFADAGDGILKGSGRSIRALHLRDALDLVSKREPGLLLKFGGHAMAAGLSIRSEDFEQFSLQFEQVVSGLLAPSDLQACVEVDGALTTEELQLETAAMLERQVWGQGFPPPCFFDEFTVINQRIVGERHLKLKLEKDGRQFDAIYFQQDTLLPARVSLIYELQVNEYNGNRLLQLAVQGWQPVLPNRLD